jgi:uncharacterized protein YeaO (DUF488 family)
MTGPAEVAVARVGDRPTAPGRAYLLVDRIWPRGVARAALPHDAWLRDVAPSDALRKWFGHDPARRDAFGQRYRAELDANPEAVARALDWCRRGPVTLLFSARDRTHNQAVVLRDYLRERLEQEESKP